MASNEKQLFYLDELSDYKLKNDGPDVRGWDVISSDEQRVGTVENLVMHKPSGKAVYLDVELDESIMAANREPSELNQNQDVQEFVDNEGENHVIVPVGLISVDEENKSIRANSVDYQTFAKTKRIRNRYPVERNYEQAVLNAYETEDRPGSGEGLELKKGFEDEAETAYMDNFYERKAFDRSPPFRFGL